MAMAVSYRAGGVLSSTLSVPLPNRWRKNVSGKATNCVSFSNVSALRPSFRLLGSGPGFSCRAVAQLNGSKEGKGISGAVDLSRSRSKKGVDRQIGVPASSSSSPSSLTYAEEASLDDGDGGNGFSGHGGGGGGGGGGDNGFGRSESSGAGQGGNAGGGGILGAFLRGWDARVKADPQFVFKVLMEEIIGVGACVLGDMATRPNFGLDELDLVFSTLVVGSILNFTLMYMLAPTAAAGAVASKLPGIFASSPAGHMFETGSYSLLERTGTFVYKGIQFAAVGFCAGLVGTGLSNLLINTRKKLDPGFVSQSASPPVLLNANTWALHMGLSSNARYQTLNGLEFALANGLSPGAFKFSVTVLRGLNNILGGTSFVALARLTGSQPPTVPPPSPDAEESSSLEHAVASS